MRTNEGYIESTLLVMNYSPRVKQGTLRKEFSH